MTRAIDFLLQGVLSPSCEAGSHEECPGRSVSRFQGRRHITVCIDECHDGPRASVEPPLAPVVSRRRRGVPPSDETVSAVMSEMGRRGGNRGGQARARALTPERRHEIARQAAAARWGSTPTVVALRQEPELAALHGKKGA